MYLNGVHFDNISINDLEKLIDNEVEGQLIDFKRALSKSEGTKEQQRADFCKDIVGFANAFGGWLIFGMTEKDGIATKLEGVEDANIEKTQTDLTTHVMVGIEPSATTLVKIRSIPLNEPDKYVILVYVAPSFQKPHRVKLTGKFHYRSASTTGELSMDELRQTFLATSRQTNDVYSLYKQNLDIVITNSEGLIREDLLGLPTLSIVSIPITNLGQNNIDLRRINSDTFSSMHLVPIRKMLG